MIARAETEANEVRQRAEADIQAQRQRALSELRGDVAQLSIDLAERIVERNLDHDTQRRLVDSFIDQVGSN
jgi:F-type H+-transporting ATPase subunit b